MYDTIGLEHWIISSNANGCACAQNIAAKNERVTLAEHVTHCWRDDIINVLLEWTTSLDTSSRTLFVREGGSVWGCPRHVERRVT